MLIRIVKGCILQTFFLSGGFGLALFYMISGYLLANIQENTCFGKWYVKKLFSLYIPLWLIVGAEVLIGYIKINNVIYFIKRFVYPGMWFTASMIILYACYYIFVRCFYSRYKEKSIYVGISVLFVIYLCLYLCRPAVATFSFEHLNLVETFSIETPYLITHTAWMSSMLIGLYIRKNWICGRKNISPVLCLGIVGTCVVIFAGQRFLEKMEYSFVSQFEFLLPIIYVVFAIGMFGLHMRFEDQIKKIMHKPVGKAITDISHSSIEIYYIQFIWIAYFREIIFPINLLTIFIGMCVSAVFFHSVSQSILRCICR